MNISTFLYIIIVPNLTGVHLHVLIPLKCLEAYDYSNIYVRTSIILQNAKNDQKRLFERTEKKQYY